jgi:hypothetical protein
LLTTIQISLQGRYNRHAAWILNGVVLRIAQKMGLHRDGEVLGLSPFETEIRRRVWWQIMMVDAKYALMSGLSHSMLPRVWDTKEPKNVNDADLFPAATEPVQDREGPTEMIMVMVFNRLARFLVETPGVEPMILLSDHEAFRGPHGPSSQHIEMYKVLIANLATSLLEITDKFCDPTAGPLHEMALEVKAEVLQKLEHMLLPAKEREFSDEVKTPADNVFQVAVEATTHNNELKMKAKNNLFAWFSRLYFQDNMFMFIVGQLCIRTTGKLVEKAWIAVETTYDSYPDLYDVTQRSYYQIALYVLRAWRTRVGVLRARASLSGMPVVVPEFITKLRAVMPAQDETASSTTSGAAAAATVASIKSEASSSASLSMMDGPGIASVPSTGPSTVPDTAATNNYNAMNNINTVSSSDTLVPAIDELSLLGGGDKAMLTQTNDQVLDQLLSQPYMDPNTIDWDMWGSIMPTGSVATPFDNFNSLPDAPW